jgi:hypothetical protein
MALRIATLGAAPPTPQNPSAVAELRQWYSDMKKGYTAAKQAEKRLKESGGKGGGLGPDLDSPTQLIFDSENPSIEDMIRVAAKIASFVDPTGVSGVVGAYTYSKCSALTGGAPPPESAPAPPTGTPSLPLSAMWRRLDGQARDAGVGADGTTWVVGNNPVSGGYDIYKRNNTRWERIPGGAIRIDVDPKGNPWIVSDNGKIFRGAGGGWSEVPGGGRATDIGIGASGAVWVVGANRVSGGYAIARYKSDNTGWELIPGGAIRIDVDPNGNPWIVSDDGKIFRGAGGGWSEAPGNGRAIDITVGADGVVYVLGTDGRVYKLVDNKWVLQAGMHGSSISAGPAGILWKVTNNNEIWTTAP